MKIQEGEPAPNFQAKVTDGEDVSDFELQEAVGEAPIVLGFFPFAFTSVCERQMVDLRDHIDELEAAGAQVFGVSVDSPFALKRFHQDSELEFEIISDYNREAVEAFGLFYDSVMGLEKPAQRATVVLDSEGNVAWTWTTEDPGTKPDIEEILGVVQKV